MQHCKAKVSGSYARIDGCEDILFLPETEKNISGGKNEVKNTQLRLIVSSLPLAFFTKLHFLPK